MSYMSVICRNFRVRRDFISDPKTLKKSLVIVGIAMLALSPFIIIFMLVYLFLKHAEQFYNHPSTASSRRWSNLSRWILREFNEVILNHYTYWFMGPLCVVFNCMLENYRIQGGRYCVSILLIYIFLN